MKKILDYFYSLLETYGGKICIWSWTKRWKNREEGTGYQINESWIDGYRKWKNKLKENRLQFEIGIRKLLQIDTVELDVESVGKEHEELINTMVMGMSDLQNFIYPFGKNAVNIKIGDTWSPPLDSMDLYMGDGDASNYMLVESKFTLDKVKQKKGDSIAYISAAFINLAP